MAYSVVLEGGSPWGFRLQGGVDFNEPLKIAKVNQNSKAGKKGVKVGDYLDVINSSRTEGLRHHEALQLMKNADHTLTLHLRRADGTISTSETNVHKPAAIVNSPAKRSTSEAQLNGNMNGDIRANIQPYIMNNNEGESTIKKSKPSAPHSDPVQNHHISSVQPPNPPTDMRSSAGMSPYVSYGESNRTFMPPYPHGNYYNYHHPMTPPERHRLPPSSHPPYHHHPAPPVNMAVSSHDGFHDPQGRPFVSGDYRGTGPGPRYMGPESHRIGQYHPEGLSHRGSDYHPGFRGPYNQNFPMESPERSVRPNHYPPGAMFTPPSGHGLVPQNVQRFAPSPPPVRSAVQFMPPTQQSHPAHRQMAPPTGNTVPMQPPPPLVVVEDLSGPSQNLAAEELSKSRGLSLFLKRQEQCKGEVEDDVKVVKEPPPTSPRPNIKYKTLPLPRKNVKFDQRVNQQSHAPLRPISARPADGRPAEQSGEVKGPSVSPQPSTNDQTSSKFQHGVKETTAVNDPHLSPSLRRLQRQLGEDQNFQNQPLSQPQQGTYQRGSHDSSFTQIQQQQPDWSQYDYPASSYHQRSQTLPVRSARTVTVPVHSQAPQMTQTQFTGSALSHREVPPSQQKPAQVDESPFKVHLKSTNQNLWSDSSDGEAVSQQTEMLPTPQSSVDGTVLQAGGSSNTASSSPSQTQVSTDADHVSVRTLTRKRLSPVKEISQESLPESAVTSHAPSHQPPSYNDVLNHQNQGMWNAVTSAPSQFTPPASQSMWTVAPKVESTTNVSFQPTQPSWSPAPNMVSGTPTTTQAPQSMWSAASSVVTMVTTATSTIQAPQPMWSATSNVITETTTTTQVPQPMWTPASNIITTTTTQAPQPMWSPTSNIVAATPTDTQTPQAVKPPAECVAATPSTTQVPQPMWSTATNVTAAPTAPQVPQPMWSTATNVTAAPIAPQVPQPMWSPATNVTAAPTAPQVLQPMWSTATNVTAASTAPQVQQPMWSTATNVMDTTEISVQASQPMWTPTSSLPQPVTTQSAFTSDLIETNISASHPQQPAGLTPSAQVQGVQSLPCQQDTPSAQPAPDSSAQPPPPPPQISLSEDKTESVPAGTGDRPVELQINSEQKPASWSPEQQARIPPAEEKKLTGLERREFVPVWSPSGSTNTIKKEFKSVKLDTSVKKVSDQPQRPSALSSGESLAWKSTEPSPLSATTTTTTITSATSSPATTTTTTSPTSTTASSSLTWNGNISNMEDSKSGLPKPQSPTITLLQKGREGQLPRGAVYVGTKEVIEGDVKHIDTYYVAPSEEKTTTVTKTVKKAPKYEGTGPVTGEGMPTGLKTTIDEKHQKDWYKKIYKSIHKTERGKDENTYKPTYVFPSDSESEKEELSNPYTPSYEYPSKYSEKDERPWTNLDKIDPSINDKKFTYEGYGKEPMSYAHARSKLEIYKNQPRSITDYEPGFSSIAFKEAKTDDSTAEDKGVLFNPPIEKPGQFSKYSVKGHISEPDIRKAREQRSVSPTDSHEAYRIIQKGGEIPLSGLRLPAPEKADRSFEDITWACVLSTGWLVHTLSDTNSLISPLPCFTRSPFLYLHS